MSSLLKRLFILATAIHITAVLAVKPPNYIDKPKVPDKYPPKYEYNYFVANHHTQAAQGHKEIRNGDFTRGNYFVNLPKGESKTTVNYIADEWGFFPVTRYFNRGPHHRVSGHFALGQHAVERLNETNLNTNEVFIHQSPDYTHALSQQQAQATFPAAQVVYPTTIDSKPPLSSSLNAPNQPHQQQQIVFQSPGTIYKQQIPQQQNQEKHSMPLVYQQAPPLIYQYAQQPQINYFYQPKPQEVIYHQQPIASMAPIQQQQQIVFIESERSVPEAVAPNNGNVNVEEISSPQVDGVNGNLIQVQPEAQNNVAADNQRQAKLEKDEVFGSPIIVKQQDIPVKGENETVIVQPNQQGPVTFQSYQPPQKQFNIQILTEASQSNYQATSDPPQVINGHTNSNNFQYLVDDDQDRLDSTPKTVTEAPSRQFLKKFKNFRTYEQSTESFATSTTKTITKVINESGGCCKENVNTNCCKDKTEEKVLEITQRPVPNQFLAPVHAGVRLNNVKLEDCVDEKLEVVDKKTINVVVEEQRQQAYGERIIISSTPATRIVTQPIFIEKNPIVVEKQHHTEVIHPPVVIEKSVFKEIHVPVEKPVYIKTPPRIIDRPVFIKSPPETRIVEKIVNRPVEVERVVEKFVDRPYYIKSPPETKVVQQQVIVEKPVIKEVQVPVEKTVFVKSPPETKIVHQPVIHTIEKIVQQPVEVEKIVEKIVDRPVFQTVEKPVYIEKIIDRPVERIVEKPIVQTVERIVDRPIHVEKFIDRPYPVPYAVGIPYEKHVYLKPDFHVVAKPISNKLFDFDGLFGFLSKKKEVKHIYVPSSHQHQLKQLNQHQLIQSTLTTIDPVKESPVFDYTRYATTHLNPVRPVYGLPAVPQAPPVNTGYSYPNPYAGNFAYDQVNSAGAQTIPSSWVHDNIEAQQAQLTSYHLPPVHRDNYIGPTPQSDDYWAINGVSSNEGIKFRRNVENGRSFRIEYGGFHPKMSPSIEIDENGKPLKKEDN